MTLQESQIAANTTYYTLGLIGQKIISFFYFILIARFLGAEDIGRYILALSVTAMLFIFLDSGITTLITRETAQDRFSLKKYFASIIRFKISASIVVFIAAAIFVNLLGYPAVIRNLIYLASIVMIFDTFSLTFYGILRGVHLLIYESLATFIYQVIVFIIGVLGLYIYGSVYALMIALIFASAFNVLFSYHFLKKHLHFSLFEKGESFGVRRLIALSLPFAVAAIFIKIIFTSDTILLSLFRSGEELGWYGVAHKFLFALEFVPLAFSASLFPAMSSYYINDKNSLFSSLEKSSFYLMLIAFPISLGGFLLTSPIIEALYGNEFAGSAASLRFLLLGLPFLFLNYPLISFFAAIKRQNLNIYFLGAALMVNLAFNFILIPRIGGAGAAIAFVSAMAVLFIINIIAAKIVSQFSFRGYFMNAFSIFLSAGAMAFVIWLIRFYIPWWAGIICGAIIYAVILITGRLISMDDFKKFALQIIRKTSNEI